jgi:formate dehydrogenase maturation protein FdhE
MNQDTSTSTALALTNPQNEDIYRSALTEFHGVIQSVYAILSDFNEVSLASRHAFSDCDTKLRETLSSMRSLRRKDFDQWFQQVKRTHDETESDLRTSVQEFLAEQTELSDNIIREFSSLNTSRTERLAELSILLADFSRLQATRRDTLRAMLADFKAAQAKWQEELKTMLAEAKQIRLQDVKALFEKFHHDSKQRRLAMLARRAEVAALLDAFRKERLNKFSKS